MRANQSYLVSEANLLVEGVDDYWVIAELSGIFERDGYACLPSEVMITAAGGASEIVPLATFMIGQGLGVVALFDSDNAGKLAEEQLRKKWITCYKNARAETLLIGDAMGNEGLDVTLEDLFPDDYYVAKVRASHEQRLNDKGLDTSTIELCGSGPILPRLRERFKQIGVELNKGSVAKLIRADLIRCSNVEDLPIGVKEKGEVLMKSLRRAFGANLNYR